MAARRATTGWGQRVWDALFPLTCPGCGASGEIFCDACATAATALPRMPPPPGLDAWVVPFAYTGGVRRLVTDVKYRNARAALSWLAAHVAGELELLLAGADVRPTVTWPPTTRSRSRERGFDQAELLARGVAARLDLRAARLLLRVGGRAQTGRSGPDRRRGPDFVAAGAAPEVVVVVDDVTTTGSTLQSAARALRDVGCKSVIGAAAARTPFKDSAAGTDKRAQGCGGEATAR